MYTYNVCVILYYRPVHLIIDSIIHTVTPYMPLCTTLYYRQMSLGQFLRQLTRLAEEFGIAVVLTNQVSILYSILYILSCYIVIYYMFTIDYIPILHVY